MRLFRRGNSRSWFATFYENGVRVQRTTKCVDRKAAEVVARQMERDAADPESAVLQAATLSDALQLLLKTRSEEASAGRKSESTVAFYRTCAVRRCNDRGPPEVPLARVEPGEEGRRERLRDWIGGLQQPSGVNVG